MSSLPTQPIAIIADDEDLGRLLLAETAVASGLSPLSFDNGVAALEAALSQDVAIVLLDVDMPGMDGYTVCRRLRADPRFATVPIVMVTGHEDSAAITRAFDAGATDFISKPVNWALLPRRLAYILRNAAASERIERLAYFDTLTGLPNRQRCIDVAERLFAEAAIAEQQVAVIYVDLNSFKRVNDTFGHTVGDAVLKSVAVRLKRAVVPFQSANHTVSVARFGGDEFVVLVSDAQALAPEIAGACAAALNDPITREGLEFYSAPSIGIAVYPDHGSDVATVLKHADTAMYQAKAGASGSIVMYTPALSARLRDWLDLEGRLRRAVQEDKLELHYQPKFRLSDHRLMGAEALLRWCDAEHGEIPPTRFIEIAEDSGLIIELGAWVIRAVCRQLRAWQDSGHSIPVAINVSGKELLHGDPAWTLEAQAAAAGIPVSLIEVEMTELVWSRTRPGCVPPWSGCASSVAESRSTISAPAIRRSVHHPISPGPHQDRQGVRPQSRSIRERFRHRQCNPVTRREPECGRDGPGRRAARSSGLAAQARLPRGAGLLVVEAAAGARVQTAIYASLGRRTRRSRALIGAPLERESVSLHDN